MPVLIKKAILLRLTGFCDGRVLARISVLSAVFFLLNGVAMADDREDFLSQLLHLRTTATSVTLMIVPGSLLFPFNLSEEQLPSNACLYDVSSNSEVSEILGLLERNVKIRDKPADPTGFDFRIALIFKSGADVVQSFYFEDPSFGGMGYFTRKNKGYTNWREHPVRLRLKAEPSFPTHLRALAKRLVPTNRDHIIGGEDMCGSM